MAFQSYSTGNKIQGAGAKSICESMMTNKSITTLFMNRKHEKNRNITQHITFFMTTLSKDNNIGYVGATGLSEALKTNKTLTKLRINCEHKNDTQMMPKQTL